MKKSVLLCLTLFALMAADAQQNTLWYTQPARRFEEALPLGNGRMGAMVYGGIQEERIALNEQTLWAGKPIKAAGGTDHAPHLEAVRKALFAEDYRGADSLVRRLQGAFSESYAPLGDLHISMDVPGNIEAYQRSLDLENAMAQTRFAADGTTYSREVFVSYPQQVIVIRLKATGKNKINCRFHFSGLLPAKTWSQNGQLAYRGHAPIHAEPSYRGDMPNAVVYDSVNAMRFLALLKITRTDGKVEEKPDALHLSEATDAIIVISMATSFIGYNKNPGTEGKNEWLQAGNNLKKASGLPFLHLWQSHTADYRRYFNRLSIDLGGHEKDKLETTERLRRFSAGEKDNSLIALYYQYARYLLISCSRPGGIPANLQGIWNQELRPPWSSNYTTNINAEMNYWSAEVANLPEMHEPLLSFIETLSKTGAQTAKEYYNARGWVCHHNSDIWGMTNPVGDFGKGDPCWANWPLGSAWLSTHLWEHYQFTLDRKFLAEKAYPLMKGAVTFFLDFLVKDPKGFYVTAPSTSPENVYITDKGYRGQTLYGSTADLAMIRQLFNDFTQASRLLRKDSAFREKVNQVNSQLYPYQIGKKGHLQEWYHDWADADPKHRHLSHLFGAYPGNTITTRQTPDWANAVRQSLTDRTNEGTGWAITWRINLWARMKNAERAYDAVKNLLRFYTSEEGVKMSGGGTYANLFCAHPPFQIDGNFGGAAGIAEMLIQSHDNYIELLPALPAEWPTGTVEGFRARGGFVVGMRWEEGKLRRASVTSTTNTLCRLLVNGELLQKEMEAGVPWVLEW